MISLVKRLFPIEDLKETLRRFPLSVLCVACIFIVAIFEIHDITKLEEDTLWRGLTTLISLYFWFGISRLTIESRTMTPPKQAVMALAGAIALVVLFTQSSLYWIVFAFVLPALLLAITVAPCLFGGNDFSLWQFNRKLWMGVAFASLAAGIFWGGLTAALSAVEHLFKIDVDEKLYADILAFSSCILGPVYALARVPGQFEYSREDCHVPPGLRFMSNWISVPIVFVYLLILYAYFIRIVATGEVPNGYLAWLITGFVGIGVVTYLAGWPLKDRADGLPHLRLFYRIFFPALFIPVGFHFFAIWERIGAYGVTEQRYVILISAFWFLIIALAKSLKNVPLKIIPATLCLLLALSSFGPWGAVSVSGASQKALLEKLLNKYELLENGKAVKLEEGKTIPLNDRVSISSILDYMCSTKRFGMIEPMFNTEGKTDWSCHPVADLTLQLGFKYVYGAYRGRRSGDVWFNVSSRGQNVLEVKGYDYMLRGNSLYKKEDGKESWKNQTKVEGLYDVEMTFDGTVLDIAVDKYEPVKVDVVQYVKVIIGEGELADNHNFKSQDIDGENRDLRYKIHSININGAVKDGGPEPVSFGFDFLFRVK